MKGIDSPSLDPLEAGKRGEICLVRSFVDQNKIYQLQGRLPSNVPAHGKQTNTRTLCSFRWWGAPRLWSWKSETLWQISCGVWLGPMLEWFFSLARLGQEGSKEVSKEVRKYPTDGRPKGDDPSSNYSGPKRNGSYAIFEIKWGNAISSKSALHPARDAFLHKSHRTWRLWHVQGWRQQDLVFVMSAMKMQASDMQSPENVLLLCSMNALSVRWLPLVKPTRWRTEGAANNSTFRIACGLSSLVGQNWADNGYIHE